MKQKFNFKNLRKAQNKILQDCNGYELEFPEIDISDSPTVGDKISIDGKSKETGERLMPNGNTFVFVDGIITKIIEKDKTMQDLKNDLKTVKNILGINDKPEPKKRFVFKKKTS